MLLWAAVLLGAKLGGCAAVGAMCGARAAGGERSGDTVLLGQRLGSVNRVFCATLGPNAGEPRTLAQGHFEDKDEGKTQ